MLLKWIFRKWNEVVDWIDVAPDRNMWRAVVSGVMNIRVH